MRVITQQKINYIRFKSGRTRGVTMRRAGEKVDEAFWYRERRR